MRTTILRSGFTRVELLVVSFMIGMIAAILLPGLVQAQTAGQRMASLNNMKQIGLAVHVYHDTSNMFPPNDDANHFSAFAQLLPYIEQANLHRSIDLKKPVTDKANAAARKTFIKLFVSPQDQQKTVSDDLGPTNYVLCAGSKAELAGNDGVFAPNAKVGLAAISNANGTSNTVMVGETLKGDGGKKAVDVKRQYVALKKDALKNLKEDGGVQDWKDGKNIAGDRCASWMDGRFLQATFTATRLPNAPEPDVDCEGLGGMSALRSGGDRTNVLYCDGHVSSFDKKIDLKVWKAICNYKNVQPVTAP
jgi:prepilin-type processing-associated H-X9-DG protein